MKEVLIKTIRTKALDKTAGNLARFTCQILFDLYRSDENCGLCYLSPIDEDREKEPTVLDNLYDFLVDYELIKKKLFEDFRQKDIYWGCSGTFTNCHVDLSYPLTSSHDILIHIVYDREAKEIRFYKMVEE